MSIVDKVIAAVTPPETDRARLEARRKARDASTPGSWLAEVLAHHVAIEAAFEQVEQAKSAATRVGHQRRLAALLTAHSVAEENVLYPALAHAGEKAHAVTAYTEQSAAKMQLGLLEYLEPTSEDYLDKFGHLRGAVLHHMYAEEGNWFLDLQGTAVEGLNVQLTSRYREEFRRYQQNLEELAVPSSRLSKPSTRRTSKSKAEHTRSPKG